MKWTLLQHSNKLCFVVFAAPSFDAPSLVGRSKRPPLIVASVATAFVVVILCTFGVSIVESSSTALNKGFDMQNVGVWSKVMATDDDASTMRLQQQQHHSHHPHKLSLYKGFERKMGQLSEYARDRFDSSQASSFNNVAVLENGVRVKHMKIDNGLGTGKQDKINGLENIKQPSRSRRKRQTRCSQSLLINDKRLHQLRSKEEANEGDRFSTARLRMNKVFSILIPSQRRPTSVDGIWGDQIGNAEDNAVNGGQSGLKNYKPDVQDVRNAPFLDGNWMEANEQAIAGSHRFHQPKNFESYEEYENTNDKHVADAPLTNACELCSSYSPSASAYRCCSQDAKPHDESLYHKQHSKLITNHNPLNKSKRQTPQKVTKIKAIKSYQTLGRNQQLLQPSVAVYPEIVAKTSSLLSPDNYRQPHSASRFGNTYADFLNYYDQHQQVGREQLPHNLLSSSLLSSAMMAGGAPSSPSSTGGESLYPVVPNINITAHPQAVHPLPTSNTTTPDYYNNNNSSHSSTPLATNAPSASSVSNATTTTGAEGGAAEGSGGGEGGAGAQSCAKYMDASNTSAVLQRVLDELERIRTFKEGQMAPEGSPCSILGSWNSEIIGLRFDINKTTANNNNNPSITSSNSASTEQVQPHVELMLSTTTAVPENISSPTSPPQPPPPLSTLNVRLFDHNPPKRNTLMSTNWSTLGTALNYIGGPFSITATVPKEQILATFTGICKTCGGQDTIFGTWSIAHPAKDCGDLQTAIETRRDIFRREMMFVKKQQKLEQLKLLNNEQDSTNEPQSYASLLTTTESTSDQTTPNPSDGSHKQVIHSSDALLDDYYIEHKESNDDNDEDY